MLFDKVILYPRLIFISYVVLFICYACNSNATKNPKFLENKAINCDSCVSNSFLSEDKNVSIDFYDNGNVKEIFVLSGIVDNSLDDPYVYLIQNIVYNEDNTIRKISISTDDHINFFYEKDSLGNITSECYNCDTLIDNQESNKSTLR